MIQVTVHVCCYTLSYVKTKAFNTEPMYLSWVLWGVSWYAVTIASLAVGYIYLSCCHLYSFASYDRPYALKTKYPVARG